MPKVGDLLKLRDYDFQGDYIGIISRIETLDFFPFCKYWIMWLNDDNHQHETWFTQTEIQDICTLIT